MQSTLKEWHNLKWLSGLNRQQPFPSPEWKPSYFHQLQPPPNSGISCDGNMLCKGYENHLFEQRVYLLKLGNTPPKGSRIASNHHCSGVGNQQFILVSKKTWGFRVPEENRLTFFDILTMLEHRNPPKRTSSSSALGDLPGALEKSTWRCTVSIEKVELSAIIWVHLGGA